MPEGLVETVLRAQVVAIDGIHGLSHWLRVRRNGLDLAALTPGADATTIGLFALLHDSRRVDDGDDRGHGARAARFVEDLARTGAIGLGTVQLDRLIAACEGHEHGLTSTDPTIGYCWDADRLDLARLDRRPIARFLSTDAARRPAV